MQYLFSLIDKDNSGLISFDEFVITVVDPMQVIKRENAQKAFKAFDSDGGGSISTDEMQEFLSPHQNIPDFIWRQVLGLKPDDDINIEIGVNEF